MKKHQMIYTSPASQWGEALPIGNGRLGAMIFGGKTDEVLQINESTVWAGNYVDRTNPKAYEALGKVREAIFSGDTEKTEEYAKDMLGVPGKIKSYQPLCDVMIHAEHYGILDNYERRLDLDDGVYTQAFTRRGDRREYKGSAVEAFADMADDLIVWRRVVDDERVTEDAICSVRRMSDVKITADGNAIFLFGTVEGGGVDFAALVRVYTDGELVTRDKEIIIKNARLIELRIAGATNYYGGDPIEKCRNTLDKVENIGYDELRARHIGAFREKTGRQTFRIADQEIDCTIPELLEKRRTDLLARDQFCELYFAWLRYLLISSNRPGCVPANLQGIWNCSMNAPWNSDYHPNVNLQISYWAAEGFNLPECVEPLIRWMKMAAKRGEKTAAVHYHAGGWVLHHVSDIYGCTEPMDGAWGIWPFGGIWMLRTLYEHYLCDPDEKYLKETLLPLIEGAVRFLLDFLVECPKGIPGEGKLVTCPSHSPENRYLDKNGNPAWLSYAATMDVEITRDLFSIYEDCLGKSGCAGKYLAQVRDAEKRLPEIEISKRYGGIREWIEDFEEFDPGHRHVSHLYAVYPGTQINDGTPALKEAAKISLARRLSHNYHGQGWSYGWIACLYARLSEGDDSLAVIDRMMDETLLPNLMLIAHGWPQVSDAQAIGAAMLEMLVHSHAGEIRLLPALPQRWARGGITGLRVRGGHLLDLEWENGILTAASVKAASDIEQVFVLPDGRRVVCALRRGETSKIV